MARRVRIAAWLLALGFCALLLFAAAAEACHCCPGGDCPVCALAGGLRALCAAVCLAAVWAVVCLPSAGLRLRGRRPGVSPVTLRVKLSN